MRTNKYSIFNPYEREIGGDGKGKEKNLRVLKPPVSGSLFTEV